MAKKKTPNNLKYCFSKHMFLTHFFIVFGSFRLSIHPWYRQVVIKISKQDLKDLLIPNGSTRTIDDCIVTERSFKFYFNYYNKSQGGHFFLKYLEHFWRLDSKFNWFHTRFHTCSLKSQNAKYLYGFHKVFQIVRLMRGYKII